MWDNFIGKQIRRCNRNLLIANLVLLGLVIHTRPSIARYLANFLLGQRKSPVTSSLICTTRPSDPDSLYGCMETIRFDTGIQSIEQTIDKIRIKCAPRR